MDPQIYKFLHFAGIMMVFLGFGALIARSLLASDNAGVRKLGSITSGIGLLLVLVSGFGMQAKLGYEITSWWILVKMAIWLAIGISTMVANRAPGAAKGLWWILLILGLVAAYLGVHFGVAHV